MGLLPHLLHHAGFFLGSALIAGTSGTILFGVLGLFFSIPMLRRLYQRYGTWRAPALALALFSAAFAFSTLVIGPAINSGGPVTPSTVPDHSSHHT